MPVWYQSSFCSWKDSLGLLGNLYLFILLPYLLERQHSTGAGLRVSQEL